MRANSSYLPQIDGLYSSMGSEDAMRLQDLDEQLRKVAPEDQPPTHEEALPELVGKTVERIEVVRHDPETFGDVLYVFFTDGTTLEIESGMNELYGLLRWQVTTARA